MKKTECIFPGSFDPVTCGHADVICRAARMFDRVYAAILHNPEKHGCFSVQEREEMLKACCAEAGNVEVVSFPGMLWELAQTLNVRVILRSFRSGGEAEEEITMARLNEKLLPGLETVFLPSRAELSCVSSSAVRQIASFHGNIHGLVPDVIEQKIRDKFGY